MKAKSITRLTRGYMLVEALVYVSVVVVLLGVGYAAMYSCINNSLALRRGADDISRALSSGERWRQDVRNAVHVRRENGPDGETFFFEAAAKTNAYLFAGTNVLRQLQGGPWTVILPNVKASTMDLVPQGQSGSAPGWTWNFELLSRSKSSRIRPLFTFSAAQTAAKP